jgi:hypothetical protein
MKKIPLTKGAFALVDDDDYEYLSQYRWYLNTEGYAIREIWTGNKRRERVRMHREVMKTPKGVEVDHVNGNRLDNRKINLRHCTRSQNNRNSAVRSDNNTGYKGVALHRHSGLYHATINVDGRQISLKYHKTPEGAARAYNKAAVKHFGKFAKLNEIK